MCLGCYSLKIMSYKFFQVDGFKPDNENFSTNIKEIYQKLGKLKNKIMLKW